MRRFIATLITGTVLFAACGSDDDGDEATTDPPSTEAPATDPPATDPPATDPPATDPPATDPPATDPPATDPPATDPPATDPPAAGGVPVNLVEWAVETEPSLAAGTITFDVSNGGQFPHEFAIARGASYKELPLFENGAIDEDALGDDFLGRTDRLESGASTSIDFDLTPGTYVFFCNIVAGPNSHAAQGQVLTVTVN